MMRVNNLKSDFREEERERKKVNIKVIYQLRVSPYIAKNSDLNLDKSSLGLRPWAAFSRPQSQFFAIQTSQLANNIYILVMQRSVIK